MNAPERNNDGLRYVWSDQWILPFESAYSALQKLAWANNAGAGEIAQDIFGQGPVEPNSIKRRELFHGSWIEQDSSRTRPSFSREVGFASEFGDVWMRLLCDKRSIRFCPLCLSNGFHTLLFQIAGLKRCPLHQVDLANSCPRCNYKWTSLALLKGTFAEPYCCEFCRKSFVDEMRPLTWVRRMEFASQIDQVFRPLVNWLRRLRAFPFTADTAPLSQLSIAGQFAGENNELGCFGIARGLCSPDMPGHLLASPARPLLIEHHEASVSAPISIDSIEKLRLQSSCFREAAERLFRTLLKPHHKCLTDAHYGVRIERWSGDKRIYQLRGICPIAAGYRRWKLRFWDEVRFRRPLCEHYKWGLFQPQDRYLKWLHAQFISCVGTAYVNEYVLRELGDGHAECDENYQTLMDKYAHVNTEAGALWSLRVPKSCNRCTEWTVRGSDNFVDVAAGLGCGSRTERRRKRARRKRQQSR